MMIIEEYADENGSGAVNIIVERDEHGEQKIVKVKDSRMGGLTTDRIRQIQDMSSSEAQLELVSARDKFIWFRH